jgi:uncharacterized glyoxalase superfamily protein PhnB
MAKKTAKKSAKMKAKGPARRKVQAIPSRLGPIVPGLAVRGAAAAIAFYVKAFGAKEVSRMPGPDGKIMHAEVRIGGQILFLGDEMPEVGAPSPQTLGGSPVAFMHYVKDVDAVFARAVAAGAKALFPPSDQFWGDRMAGIQDPFGHRWSIATHKVDLTRAQMKKAMDAFMATHGAPTE